MPAKRPVPHHALIWLPLLLALLGGLWPPATTTQAQPAPATTAVIHGWVRDARSQAGIGGARVTLRDLSLTTLPDGTIPETPIPLRAASEQVDVTVTAPGYGLWRYQGIELQAGHRIALQISLRDQAQIIAPQADAATTGTAPYDGPPQYIRVGRTFTTDCVATANNVVRVDRVPFIDYVKNVLPNEWLPGWPDAALEAGAVAVAQYAWTTAFVQRKWSSRGFAFDVLDSTCDQVYRDRDPRRDYRRSDAAVERMWGTVLLRTTTSPPTFFTTYYRAYDWQCPHLDCMGQWGSRELAAQGWSSLQILEYYYGRRGAIGTLATAPTWRALTLYRSPDIHLPAGQTAELSACLLNIGSATWHAGELSLIARDPADPDNQDYRSPLAHASWPTPQQAATLATDAPLGAKRLLRFTVAAPAELAAGTYRLVLEATQAQTTIPSDQALTWTVQVTAPLASTPAPEGQPRVWLPLISTPELVPADCR